MSRAVRPRSRPYLFSIAYRMLSSVADAEDVVQEAYLRYHRADAEVESPKAYLSAVVTRLCIDHLRSARVRRETYVGEWLPEPLLTDGGADPEHAVVDADSLSMAFLLVLERLSPVERAVFLLHDVFGYDFAEVAGMVERTPDNCRQIGVRARRHVTEQAPRFETSRAERDELAQRFLAAFTDGDVDGLVACSPRTSSCRATAAAISRPGRTRSSAATRSRGCSPALAADIRRLDVVGAPGRGQRPAGSDDPRRRRRPDQRDHDRHRRRGGADGAVGDQPRQAAPPRPARRSAALLDQRARR